MIASDLSHGALGGRRRHAEGVPAPLNDEHGNRHILELLQAAGRIGAAGRVQRERKAKNGDGPDRPCSPAGDAGAQGSPSDEKRKATELARDQVLHNCNPGGVQLPGRRRAPATRDTVGLLDEGHAETFRKGHARHSRQVRGSHTSAGAVTEDQCAARLSRGMHVGSRQAMRRVDIECGHARDACTDEFPSADGSHIYGRP